MAASDEGSGATAVMRARCDAFKEAGNTKLKAGDAAGAVKSYTKAIALAQSLDEPRPTEKLQTCRVATLYANRCQANLALGEDRAALTDAEAAAKVAPDWPKAHFRLGSVHMRRKAYTLAYSAFKRGWHLDTSNAELTKACQVAHQAMVGLDTVVSSSGAAKDGAESGGASKPMSAEDLHRLRETAARQAMQARDAARKAQPTVMSAHPDAPVADLSYREEALARTARMARGNGAAEETTAEAEEAAAAAAAESGGAAGGGEPASPAANASSAAVDVSDGGSATMALAAEATPAGDEAGATGAAAADEGGEEGGEEDAAEDDDEEDDAAAAAAAPLEYVLTRKAGAHADGRDLLTVTVHVPHCAKLSELELAISSGEMRVEAPGAPPLEVGFKAAVDDGAAKAKWDKTGRVLTVRAPVGPAPPTEGEVV